MLNSTFCTWAVRLLLKRGSKAVKLGVAYELPCGNKACTKRLKRWFCKAKKLCVGATLIEVSTFKSLFDSNFCLSACFCWVMAFSIREFFAGARLLLVSADFMTAAWLTVASELKLMSVAKISLDVILISPFVYECTDNL